MNCLPEPSIQDVTGTIAHPQSFVDLRGLERFDRQRYALPKALLKGRFERR